MVNLLEEVKRQHEGLKLILNNIEVELNKKNEVFKDILVLLKEFKFLLEHHLKLENEVFYPELLIRMEAKGLDIKETKNFIAEMIGIEKVINLFVSNYDDVKKIEDKFINFKKDFADIKEAVLLRIDSEEEGVFMYY